jgi:hypothetical protein
MPLYNPAEPKDLKLGRRTTAVLPEGEELKTIHTTFPRKQMRKEDGKTKQAEKLQ